MKLKKMGKLAALGGVAVLTMLATPASAGGPVSHDESLANNAAAANRDGLDFDAGCQFSAQPPPPRQHNWVASPAPGGPGQGAGCVGDPGVTTYDGSAESVDLNTGSLSSSGTRFSTTWNTDRAFPPAGSTDILNTDLPNNTFVGGGLYTLFRNPDKQHNGDNLGSGCTGITSPRVRDQNGHYLDGYQFFANVDYQWNGTKWVWHATIGDVDPSPDGAFFFIELGTNDGVDDDGDGNLWDHADPAYPYGTKWSVTPSGNSITLSFDGRHVATNGECVGGLQITDFGSNVPGPYSPNGPAAICGTTYTSDCIIDVKFLTTANSTVSLPVTVPVNQFCEPTLGLVCGDISQVGGFLFFVDTTAGNSTAGIGNTNPTGLAYSGGLIGVTDTLGDGPTCPTSTRGGTLPDNPLWVQNQNQSCQIDDDNVGFRGSFFSEWWNTNLSFKF